MNQRQLLQSQVDQWREIAGEHSQEANQLRAQVAKLRAVLEEILLHDQQLIRAQWLTTTIQAALKGAAA